MTLLRQFSVADEVVPISEGAETRCPRCDKERTGWFRYCRVCGHDFEAKLRVAVYEPMAERAAALPVFGAPNVGAQGDVGDPRVLDVAGSLDDGFYGPSTAISDPGADGRYPDDRSWLPEMAGVAWLVSALTLAYLSLAGHANQPVVGLSTVISFVIGARLVMLPTPTWLRLSALGSGVMIVLFASQAATNSQVFVVPLIWASVAGATSMLALGLRDRESADSTV